MKNLFTPELLAQFKAGNVEAFNTIYKEYYQFVAEEAANKFLHNKQDGMDVATDVFEVLWKKRATIEELSLTYIYTVMTNKCISLIRRRRTARRNNNEMGLSGEGTEEPGETREREHKYLYQLSLIQIAMVLMTRAEREIFYLRFFKKKSSRLIASKKGLSIKTIQKQMRAAIMLIRSLDTGAAFFFILFLTPFFTTCVL